MVATMMGGIAAEATGGDFSEGALTAMVVFLYNDVYSDMMAARNGLGRKTPGQLLKEAKDGHLTLEEANAWYKYKKGEKLVVDGNKLNHACVGSRCAVTGSDYLVHGQVSVKKSNQHIYDGKYDFEMHGKHFFDDGYYGVRNLATIIGKWYAGKGQAFWILYRYDGKYLDGTYHAQ